MRTRFVLLALAVVLISPWTFGQRLKGSIGKTVDAMESSLDAIDPSEIQSLNLLANSVVGQSRDGELPLIVIDAGETPELGPLTLIWLKTGLLRNNLNPDKAEVLYDSSGTLSTQQIQDLERAGFEIQGPIPGTTDEYLVDFGTDTWNIRPMNAQGNIEGATNEFRVLLRAGNVPPEGSKAKELYTGDDTTYFAHRLLYLSSRISNLLDLR